LVSGSGLYGRQTPIPDRQQAPPPPATGLIVGQVVDAATGRPVPGAIVSLAASTAALLAAGLVAPGEVEMTAAGPAVPTRMITDSEGRFVLRNLAKGRYTFSTTAIGYLLGQYGQARAGGPGSPLELEEGEKIFDATIKLWKAATITGTVFDEANEPVVGITVRTLRRGIFTNRPRWLMSNTTQTDDRGFYRIAGLTPGDYGVAVVASTSTLPAATVDSYMETMMSGQGGTTSPLYRDLMASGAPSPTLGLAGGFRLDDFVVQPTATFGRNLLPPAPAEDGKMLAFQTVYHPAATSVAQMSVITLSSGEEKTGIDLHLRLVPTFRVSGTVTGPEGPVANMGVKLLPATIDEFSSDVGLEVVNTATDAQGAFTFFGVPPGAYTLKVLKMPRPLPTPMSEGMVMMSSGAGGVAFGTSFAQPPAPPPLPTDPTHWATLPVNVTEANISGLTVSLRPGYRVTGRVEFEGTRDRPTAEQIQRMPVILTPLDSRQSGVVTPGRISPDGQFRTLGFPPGKYLVNVSTGAGVEWTLKTATFGGRDVSVEPLEIAGNDIDGVVLVLTDRLTQLSGTVRNAQGQGDAQADVVIFPADSQLWKQYGVTPRRARSVRATRTGAYSTQGLPAGDYYVVAVEGTSSRDWQDPKFLEAAARVATRVTIIDGDKKALDLKTTRIR
jgi:hypothetical protein